LVPKAKHIKDRGKKTEILGALLFLYSSLNVLLGALSTGGWMELADQATRWWWGDIQISEFGVEN
jgi:hypothetical protein